MVCSKNFDPSSRPKSKQVQCKSGFDTAKKLVVAVDAAYAGATFWCAPLPNSLPIPSFCKEGYVRSKGFNEEGSVTSVAF